MTLPVLQITPRFFPQIDGLGDYSRLLAEHLRDSFGIESRFLVGDPEWSRLEKPAASPFPVEAVAERSADALLRRLETTDTVILHYVTYGYHPRGVPFWINRALRRWKKAKTQRRLVIVFHELWSSGPPWKSEFYLGPVQKHLIAELHQLADGCLTSTPNMHRRLDAIERSKTTLAPIPSCVEPPRLEAFRWHTAGPVSAVIFGQEASRQLTVSRHAKLLGSLLAAGLLKDVRMVGKGCLSGPNPSRDVAMLLKIIPAQSVSTHRDVTPEALAGLLAGSDLFLSYYPSAFLCKSSALTAAMACGCAPILPETDQSAPLVAGEEVLACDGSPAAIARIVQLIETGGVGRVGQAARCWYDGNASWSLTTQAVAGHLKSSGA